MDTYCLHVSALQIPIKLLILVLWYFRTEVLKNYDANGKNHSGSLPKSSYGVLWKQQKNKTRAPVCKIQSNNAGLREQGKNRYSMSIPAFPTLSAVCHHAGFRAMCLFLSTDGRKWLLKDKRTQGTRPLGNGLIKCSPLHSGFFRREGACVIMLIHYQHFQLSSLSPCQEKDFFTVRGPLLPEDLYLQGCCNISIPMLTTAFGAPFLGAFSLA